MGVQKKYAVVMTTVANEETAGELARNILARKLAACVQVQGIRSYYKWKGETCSEPECLLLIKTRAALFAKLEAFIRANHAHETPEIVQLPINNGSAAYLRWIDMATGE
jgi:periplasmic divalent cation tolerance protein